MSVRGKLPQTAGSPQRVRPVADWSRALPTPELCDCTIKKLLPVSRAMFSAPADSPARIEALERYDILDTPPEE
jgi:hypothetical protein